MHKPVLHIVLVITLGLLAYSNSFHVPFHLDDERFIVENPSIKDPANFLGPLKAGGFAVSDILKSYRYAGLLTFALNYRLHGLDVTGYHVFNVSVHILNALLVYWLVLLTFSASPRRPLNIQNSPLSRRLAFFSALLFVAHPVQSQGVTYIIQRFSSLATMFYLLSLVMYVKARIINTGYRSEVIGRESDNERSSVSHRPIAHYLSPIAYYLFSLFFAVLAMKTKEIAFTLPVVITAYEFMFLEDSNGRRIYYLLLLLLTMLIIPFSYIGVNRPLGEVIGDVINVTKVETTMSRLDYLLTEFRVITTYIRLMFLPVNQNLDYDYPVYRSFFVPEVFLSFFFLLFIFGVGVYLFYISRFTSRASRSTVHYSLFTVHCFRLVSFGIFWFFITLSVESSIIPITDVIFEHRVYLPSAGAFIAMTASVFLAADRIRNSRPRAGRAVMPVFVLVTVVFSGVTYARNMVWRDPVSLWEDVVKKSPNKARGYNNLGKSYHEQGRFDKATDNYNRVIAINPYFSLDVYSNMGAIYINEYRYDNAIDCFTRLISINGNEWKGYLNRGIAYYNKGVNERAIEDYNKAISIQPAIARIYTYRARAYLKAGDKRPAAADFQKACDLGDGAACGELQNFKKDR